jgi:hypothetical protein
VGSTVCVQVLLHRTFGCTTLEVVVSLAVVFWMRRRAASPLHAAALLLLLACCPGAMRCCLLPGVLIKPCMAPLHFT